MRGESRFRVYYEDTDMAGIVYYANYLKFMERGRSDAVREAGIDQRALREAQDLVFAVSRLTIDYIASARLDDVLTVLTRTDRIGAATLELTQEVLCMDRPLARATVRVACMTTDGKVRRIPADIRQRLHGAATEPG